MNPKRMRLVGAVQVGKTLTVKREKEGDDQVLRCSLGISDLFIDRHGADLICGQKLGWSEAFFDSLGAPVAALEIHLADRSCEATGQISRGEGMHADALELRAASLNSVRLDLTPNGMLLACRFTWETAGDEAADVSGLLGRSATLDVTVDNGGQIDALREEPT